MTTDETTETECPACAHSDEHGWWGPTIGSTNTHDRDTHVTYPGTNVWGSCSACGNMFHGLRSFTDHSEASPSLCEELVVAGVDAWTDDAPVVWKYLKIRYERLRHDRGWWYYGTTGPGRR